MHCGVVHMDNDWHAGNLCHHSEAWITGPAVDWAALLSNYGLWVLCGTCGGGPLMSNVWPEALRLDRVFWGRSMNTMENGFTPSAWFHWCSIPWCSNLLMFLELNSHTPVWEPSRFSTPRLKLWKVNLRERFQVSSVWRTSLFFKCLLGVIHLLDNLTQTLVFKRVLVSFSIFYSCFFHYMSI